MSHPSEEEIEAYEDTKRNKVNKLMYDCWREVNKKMFECKQDVMKILDEGE